MGQNRYTPNHYDVARLDRYIVGARRTAMPTAWSLNYLAPGILSELGEIAGKLAKFHRDGWTVGELEHELRHEYGDVCWGTAILICHMSQLGHPMLPGKHSPPIVQHARSHPEVEMLRAAVDLYREWEHYVDTQPNYQYGREVRERAITKQAHKLWAMLEAHCFSITGSTFDSVLKVNLDKLAGRAERNVLTGSGDHR